MEVGLKMKEPVTNRLVFLPSQYGGWFLEVGNVYYRAKKKKIRKKEMTISTAPPFKNSFDIFI